MYKKPHSLTFNHEISGKNRLLVITTMGPVDAVQTVQVDGVGKIGAVVKKKYFVFNRRFPFIHRKEIGVYYGKIEDDKPINSGGNKSGKRRI